MEILLTVPNVLRKGENTQLPTGNDPLLLALVYSGALHVDANLFLLNENGRVINDQGFIFYNQPATPCGSVRHLTTADPDFTGGKEGFLIDLARIQLDVQRLVLCLTHRGHISESLCTLKTGSLDALNTTTNAAITRYPFLSDIHDESALIVAEVYRHKGHWKIRAVGQGFIGGPAALATRFGVQIQQNCATSNDTDWVEDVEIDGVSLEPQRKRRSPHEILADHSEQVRKTIAALLPKIQVACTKGENESATRLILDRVLQDVLGYAIENTQTEKVIEGKRADYVLSVRGQDVIVVEAKRAGTPLKKRHAFQAISYGAFAGIRWVLLTNLVEWQLYRIATGDKLAADLVFTVNMKDGIDDESIYHLTLVSQYGMTRQGLLEKLWRKLSKLSSESLGDVILSAEIVNKIRSTLSRDLGFTLTAHEVRSAIKRNVLQLND